MVTDGETEINDTPKDADPAQKDDSPAEMQQVRLVIWQIIKNATRFSFTVPSVPNQEPTSPLTFQRKGDA